MLKNRKSHYVPDFEHHRHKEIKSHGGDDSYDPIHDFSPEQLGHEKIVQVRKWMSKHKEIKGVLLIGSYARGDERSDSDIDFVVIVDDVEKWTMKTSWTKNFGQLLSTNLEKYEEVTDIRAYYQDGNELEFGFVTPEWLNRPYSDVTRETLEGGYKILVNKNNTIEIEL